jgi:hypothetical protein
MSFSEKNMTGGKESGGNVKEKEEIGKINGGGV